MSAPAPFSSAYQRMSLLSVIREPGLEDVRVVGIEQVQRVREEPELRADVGAALDADRVAGVVLPDEAQVPVAVQGLELRARELRGGGTGVVGVVGAADLDGVVVGGPGRARDRGRAGRGHRGRDGPAAEKAPAVDAERSRHRPARLPRRRAPSVPPGPSGRRILSSGWTITNARSQHKQTFGTGVRVASDCDHRAG